MLNLGRYSATHITTPIRIYPTLVDRILEGVALLLIIAVWGLTLWIYTHAADKSAIAFIFQVAAMGTVCSLIMAWGAYISIQRINFPVRITEQNVAIQWFWAKRLCRVLNVILPFLFLSIILKGVQQAWGLPAGFSEVSSAVLAILVVLVMICYFVIAYRNK